MIENIFAVSIYKTKYQGDIVELQNNVIPLLAPVFEETLKDNQGSMREGGLCSYNVARNLQSIPELKDFVDFLTEHTNIYWNHLGYSGSPAIVEMWANRYSHGSFIDSHNHSPVPLTASFYLKKDKGSGNIVFEHPNEVILKHQPYSFDHRSSYHQLFDHELNVEEGDLVIFPSYIRHKTIPNQTLTDRIIIGANIFAL
jgi:uncharacterized protein (TIGR02466 family)